MRTDAMVVTITVARISAERRTLATLELMREIAPDPLHVRQIIGAFGLVDPAPHVRERAATAAAACCRDPAADGACTPPCVLHQVLEPLITGAIAACWSARDAFVASTEARCMLSRAEVTRDGKRVRLRARAEAVNAKWARLLLEAHARVEEAEGVARVIGFARHDDP